MTTITIPKNFILNDDLVIIPRKQYENLLRVKNVNNIEVKRSNSFKVSKKHEAFYAKLDKDLTKTLREVKEGKVTGSFDTAEKAIVFLNSRKK